MNDIISRHIDQIRRLFEQNKVRSLFAFGSVTTDGFKADSDIDFAVDIAEENPFLYADSYFNLKFQLEEILKRPIDLLEKKAIRNRFLKNEIERRKILIYGEESSGLA